MTKNLLKSLPEYALSALEKRFEKEIKKRTLQSDLVEFTKYFFEKRGEVFVENWHHREIAAALEKVERGEIKNLLINMPPRYGKTELAVVNWIAQCLARNPKCLFMHLSFSDELALENSSHAKELILSDAYQDFWPLTLKDDSQSKKKWYTKEGGGLYATAAGGPITGFGAGSTSDDEFRGAIIIDDPLKVDDAERDGERFRVNKRLNTTIKSRRNSRNTPIIIIMQRLHEDDMSGYVLAGGMGEDFYHLKLAAIQPDGTALWPFKHTIEELERERNADPRTFAGQMMQEPSPDDGTFFKRDWFKRFDIGKEPELIKYGCSDYAVTELAPGKDPDYTEHGIGGFDTNEDLWLLDWWYGQTTPDVWIDEELRLVRQHKPYVWAAEAGVIRRSVEPFLKKEQRTTGTYFRIEWIASSANKTANARAFQALASSGKVHIPNTPWGERLIAQLLKFPSGKHDDGVDVCGLFGRLLDQTYGPREIIEDVKKQADPYGFDEEKELDTWKTV